MEVRYATNGKANTGVALGASALGVGVLNALGGNGLLGGLLGGGNANCCNENMVVNRYEAQQQGEIERLRTVFALRDANIFSDSKSLELYRFVDKELRDIREALCAQAVHNQKTEDSFVLARQDIANVESRLNGKIKLEAERRCCADNAIVNYANATFYGKNVADVTVGTTTTAQMLYNPIPDCGCDCNG